MSSKAASKPQLGLARVALQALVLPLGELTLHHESEAAFEAVRTASFVLALFFEGLGHAKLAQPMQSAPLPMGHAELR